MDQQPSPMPEPPPSGALLNAPEVQLRPNEIVYATLTPASTTATITGPFRLYRIMVAVAGAVPTIWLYNNTAATGDPIYRLDDYRPEPAGSLFRSGVLDAVRFTNLTIKSGALGANISFAFLIARTQ